MGSTQAYGLAVQLWAFGLSFSQLSRQPAVTDQWHFLLVPRGARMVCAQTGAQRIKGKTSYFPGWHQSVSNLQVTALGVFGLIKGRQFW